MEKNDVKISTSKTEATEPIELKKELNFFTVLMLVVGIVIGSGVFYKPHALYTATGGSAGVGILSWIVGGLLSLFGALTAAEISAAVPKTGGMIEWIREAFGDTLAYLLGWAQSVVAWPAFVAALAVIFSQTALVILGADSKWLLPIAIAAIVFLTFVNCISTKLGGQIGSVATIVKLIPLAIITIVGLIKGPDVGNGIANLTPFMNPDSEIGIVSALSGGVLATLFAYQGWIDAGALAGEMKNPAKDLPKALTMGLAIICLVYTGINVAYLFVFPAEHFITSETPALDVAKQLFGSTGSTLINAGILISVFGALNANLMAGIRSPYTLAKNNQLPFSNFFKKLHPKTQTPVNSAVYIAIMACLFATTGSFDYLTNITVVTMWTFYILVFIGVMRLRRKQPELNRPYKVPFYPIIPIISILGGLAVVALSLHNDFFNNITGLFITALGLPVYYILKKYKKDNA